LLEILGTQATQRQRMDIIIAHFIKKASKKIPFGEGVPARAG
jgi:hypothetical protein